MMGPPIAQFSKQSHLGHDDGKIQEKASGSKTKVWKASSTHEFPGSVKGKGKQRIIRYGPFKGKEVVCAPTKGIDSMIHVSIAFMKNIFGLEPNGYMITDESRLSDFTDFGSGDVTPIIKKIMKGYSIDVSDVSNGNLLDIFRKIDFQQRRHPIPSAENDRPSESCDCKNFENIVGNMRRQARRAGLKRSDIVAAIREVSAKK